MVFGELPMVHEFSIVKRELRGRSLLRTQRRLGPVVGFGVILWVGKEVNARREWARIHALSVPRREQFERAELEGYTTRNTNH